MEPQLGTEQRPVTIQGTSKKIKLMILVGSLAIFAGIIMMFAGDAGTAAGGMALTLVGLVVAIAGKFMRWWKHD